ncbi:MAG TPA: hypothetical protein VGE74_07540 [Gemmata sp.]
MEIQCPTSTINVLVAGSGSGSGSGAGAGTICVRGTVGDGDLRDNDSTFPTIVRVRILAGHVPPPPLPDPDPKQPGDVDVPPVGQDWCAHDVPVPASSPTGVPLTAVAWLRSSGKWGGAQSETFYAGGTDPVDCCAACAALSPPAPPGDALTAWPPPPPPLPLS